MLQRLSCLKWFYRSMKNLFYNRTSSRKVQIRDLCVLKIPTWNLTLHLTASHVCIVSKFLIGKSQLEYESFPMSMKCLEIMSRKTCSDFAHLNTYLLNSKEILNMWPLLSTKCHTGMNSSYLHPWRSANQM